MAFARAMDALKSVGQNAGLTEQTELYDRGQTIIINKNPFRVENIIAKGGFGTVFLATNNKGGPVAVKILLCHDNAAKKDIDNEITMMKNCDHENIVQLYETSSEERDSRRGVKEYKIVMEYCKFSIADVLLKYKEVAVDFVVRIIFFTSRALVYLHQKGIVHRDIKAENLLINGKGVLKLCDFGSATAESYDMSVLSHNKRISLQEEVYKYTTPITRSPELCDVYSNWPIGKQQDIWAMGCLIYFVCFGEHPFDGSPLAIINGKYKKPPPVSENQLSAFTDLMSKCLTTDPSLRITAESIEEYMKLIMTKRPVLATKKDFMDILTHMNEISQAESLPELVPNKALINIQDKVYNNYSHFKNLLVQQSTKLGLRPSDASDSPRPNEQPTAPVAPPVKPRKIDQHETTKPPKVKTEPSQSTWTANFASFESMNARQTDSPQNVASTSAAHKKDLFDPFAEASSNIPSLSAPKHSEDLLSLQGWPGTVDHVVMKTEMKSQSSKDLFDFDDLLNRHAVPTQMPTALQPTKQVENKVIKKVDNSPSKNGIGPSSSSASLDDMVSQMLRMSTPQSNNK